MEIEPTFSIFYINWFRIVSLHNHSRLSDFGAEFAEIFIIKNQLPALVSRRVADTAYQRYRSCHLPAIMLVGVADSPHNLLRRVGLLNFFEKKTLRMGDSESCWLPASVIQWVADSPHLWSRELITISPSVLRRLSTPPRICNTGSRRLRISVIPRVDDSAYRW